VEAAVEAARAATDEAAAREARRLVEEGIVAGAQALAAMDEQEPAAAPGAAIAVGSRVRIGSSGVGDVAEIRSDGKLVVVVGAMRMVVEPGSVTLLPPAERRARRESVAADRPGTDAAAFEIDLRGMTGDEAEAATVAAVDAAVLAEHPYLRIIHGMGTGVLRERVHRVVKGDRRVARFGLAPRNQGGTGVTIVEFSP
jgi:DNA mismatch repair protein MutS2